MRKTSLKKQFLTHSMAVTLLVMMVSLLIVDVSYRSELESASRERLKLHVYGLLSLAKHHHSGISLPLVMTNPRFNDTESGLWAMVADREDNIHWQSLSVEAPHLKLNHDQDVGDWRFGHIEHDSENFLNLTYKVAWDIEGHRHDYYFVVAESQSLFQKELMDFRIRLGFGFLLTTLFLLLFQNLVLIRSFRPIGTLAKEIEMMEKGEQSAINEHYPEELIGVTESLNTLIEKEHKQRTKYRESMADLAHSLKTPLAVIRSETSLIKDNKALEKAIERIDQNVEYQLRRAVISGHSILDRGANILSALDDLLLVLNHAYTDKHIELIKHIADGLYFAGDENDLLEIFGNLLDNAYKHANEKVSVSAQFLEYGLTMTVEDDGDGIEEHKLDAIMKRGARLDSQGLGQGIGLAVVVNIVNSYDGEIKVARSELGGACFTLTFPMQKETK